MSLDRVRVQRWLDGETTRLLETVETFRDRDLSEPSTLPAWTLGHLLTHLARNADALCNLLRWAKTGIETPMYASPQQRNDDINRGALRATAAIVDDVVATAEKFGAAQQSLLPEDWRRQVRTAQGRTIPVAEVPWLRLREVAIHRVDLGARFEDLDGAVVDLLLKDITTTLQAKPQWPSIALEATDGAFLVANGTPVVKGTGAQLVSWLAGRASGADLTVSSGRLPALPAWL